MILFNWTATIGSSEIHEILAYLTSSEIHLFFISSSTLRRSYLFNLSSLVNGPGVPSFFNISKISYFVESSFRHDFFTWVCLFLVSIYLLFPLHFNIFHFFSWLVKLVHLPRIRSSLCFCWWSFFQYWF